MLNRIRSRGILAGFLLLLAGCSVGPDYHAPARTMPADWVEGQGAGIDSQPEDLAHWWSVFNDPLLNSLIDRAVKANLDLQIAATRVREARAALAGVEAGAWPTVDVSSSYSRNRASENAVGLSSQGAVGAPRPGADLEQSFYQTGCDAAWEIDVFGGTRRRIEAAVASLDAAIEDQRAVLVSLIGEVARNYIALRGLQRRLALAEANLQVQQETARLNKIRFDVGLASELEVAQAEGQALSTAAQIPVLESAAKQTRFSLDLLLGGDPGMLRDELSAEAPIPALPPAAHVGLPTELLRRRPDIRRSERQLAAATAQVGAATAALYPRFSLTGAFGLQSISASDWFTSGSRFWSIGPTISWPVFDAGRIRADLEIRNAQQAQALRIYEKSVLTGLADVESALVNYRNEQSRYRSLLGAVAANQRALDIANEQYLHGLIGFLNVLDGERTLFASQDNLALSEANMASNLVALYKALGGGWDAR